MKSEHSTEKVLEMDKQIQELFHKFGSRGYQSHSIVSAVPWT